MKLDIGFELDKPNHNNRIYTEECLKQAIDAKLLSGDLGVYLAPQEGSNNVEDLGTRVGNVTGYEINESRMTVEADIVDPKILSLIESGANVTAGPRGFGEIINTEISDVYLIKDYILNSFDLLDPEHVYIR